MKTHRRHPPPARHREDDDRPRERRGRRVRSRARRDEDRHQAAPSRSCSARRSRRSARRSCTASSSARAGSRASGSDWKKAWVRLQGRREGAGVPGRERRAVMPIRKLQTDVAGPAVPERADVRRDHDVDEPHKPLVEPLAAIGRPQQPRRAHVVVARRRPQAQLPRHRLQAGQVQHPGKVATVEYDPNRTARIALVTYADGEKRYILHPLGLKVGDTVDVGRRTSTSCRATACR